MLSSEKAEAEVWDLLALNIIESKIEKTSGKKYSDDQIRVIHTLYKQSKELYKASEIVSIECSPLIDFYCYSMLSKMIIIKNQNIEYAKLPRSHGISFELEDGKNVDTDNIFIKINKNGTFVELLNSLKKSTVINEYYSSRINLTELLYYVIDLHDYIPFNSRCLPVHSIENHEIINNNGLDYHKYKLEVRLPGKLEKETFEKIKEERPEIDFANFKTQNGFLINKLGYPIFLEYNTFADLPDIAAEMNFAGQMFIIPPVETNTGKHLFYQIEILYLILFAASNLVRYYPNQWLELISDEKRMWHLRKVISLARRSFPNYILNYLTEAYYIILPPGTLHYR